MNGTDASPLPSTNVLVPTMFPATPDLDARARDVEMEIRQLVVIDQESYREMAALLGVVKALRQEIADTFKPITRALDDAKQVALRQLREKDEPLKALEQVGKRLMLDWQEQEERARLAEQRRLQLLADQEAAERRRREEEEAAQLAAEARALRSAGDVERAAVLEETVAQIEALPVAAPVVTLPSTAKAAGASARSSWRGVLVNVPAFARGIAEGTVPPGAIVGITVNEAGEMSSPIINQEVKAAKKSGRPLTWPGVNAVAVPSMAIRAAR